MGGDGVERRLPLARAARVRFEDGRPVREFPSYRGQRNYPGLYWSATVGAHVGYESWLERDHAMALDFDPQVSALASQPLWLFWEDERGRTVSHAPDYFVRRDDGSVLLVDSRPEDRRPARDMAKFKATERACDEVGWRYALWGELDQVVSANLRWLAGYRHPRCFRAEAAGRLRGFFSRPGLLMEGAEAAGDPIAVLPVLFHLLWCQELVTDLSVLLGDRSVVRLAAGEAE
ncbi:MULTISPECIES: TnsA-like heteromeric transposase endonuclease subunit [unclassified Streptomyces]|uniref:TnsA-like heteromeric transposase endonuclease subunit n=1 Tax=unclassified Streptomyces TaxID=2593676 RepID=UPI00382170D8